MTTPRRRITDIDGLRGWLIRPSSRVASTVLFLSVCVLLGLYGLAFRSLTARLSHDEGRTCSIQKRGLPAGHELVEVMASIHALLTLPITSDEQRRRAALPARQLRLELRIVTDLNTHLAKYTELESKLPETRIC